MVDQDQPVGVRSAVEGFLARCQAPVLSEPGQPPVALNLSQVRLSAEGAWLQLEAWTEEQFVSRRIARIRRQGRGRMELTVARLGGRQGELILYDAARDGNQGLEARGRRQSFAAAFGRMLTGAFPRHRVEEIRTEASLQHSLSSSYCRALLRRDGCGVAAMAAPPGSDAARMLGFGLIWLDYLRRREPGLHIGRLALFAPAGSEAGLALRARWLDPAAAEWMAFRYGPGGETERLDLDDCGNLAGAVASCRRAQPGLEPEAVLEEQVRLSAPEVDATLRPQPVYSQVRSIAGGERGILDLLACGWDGRLAVLELKASECLDLPLQGLDYWLQVKRRLEDGDFQRRGLFPGIALRRTPPRLLLVAPATQFHPANETMLRYFHPEIEVERIGLAPLLGGALKVLFRRGRLE